MLISVIPSPLRDTSLCLLPLTRFLSGETIVRRSLKKENSLLFIAAAVCSELFFLNTAVLTFVHGWRCTHGGRPRALRGLLLFLSEH